MGTTEIVYEFSSAFQHDFQVICLQRSPHSTLYRYRSR